jgi:hypothetical protein
VLTKLLRISVLFDDFYEGILQDIRYVWHQVSSNGIVEMKGRRGVLLELYL